MAAPPTLTRITIATAVQNYLTNTERAVTGGTLSATTADNYRRDLTEFVTLAGADTILDDLTAEHLDDIVLTYAATPDRRYTRTSKPPTHPGERVIGRGTGAQTRFRQSISRLFTYAERRGYVRYNPVPDMAIRPRTSRLSAAARKAPTLDTARELLHIPEQAYQHTRTDRQMLTARDQAILRVLFEGGPRVSELCALDRADMETVDTTTWLHIRHGKGNKPRDIPLSPLTAQYIHTWLALPRPTPPSPTTGPSPTDDAERALFTTYRGRRIRPRDIQNMITRHAKLLPPDLRRHITPHAARHAAATLLLASGAADVKTVQILLGHESLATTGIYLDIVSDEVIRAIAAHPVTSQEN
jgi:site-specific recombinase XerD